jgi:hypothetical protein
LIVVVVVFFGWHGEEGGFGGVDAFAEEFKVPVGEGSVVFVYD